MALGRNRRSASRPTPPVPAQRSPRQPDYGGPSNGAVAFGLATAALAVTCVAAFFQGVGGNEHGINHYGAPTHNTMPSFSPNVPRDPDTFVLPRARQFGALVCPQNVILKTRGGVIQVIHHPVIESPNAVMPLIFVGADANGARFDRTTPGDITEMRVLNPNDTPDGSDRFHGCVPTTVRVTHLTDAHNPANNPYVLTGPNSSLHDGDRVAFSEQATEQYDLISSAVTLSSSDPRQELLQPVGP